MGSVVSFTSRSENVLVAQVEETTSCTRCSSSHVTAPSVDRRRATAPVRRRFHPEKKTASPSPSVRPGGRTPNTLTRRLLGIGVTHVTAGPGCTGLRKKAPHRAGQDGHRSHGGIECVPSCEGERLTDGRFAQGSYTVAQCCGLWSSTGQLDDVGCYPSCVIALGRSAPSRNRRRPAVDLS